MFPTATKGYREGQPAGALRRAIELADRPVVAIGGIDAATIGRVVTEGGSRVAVCSAILHADDPRAAASALTDVTAGEREGRRRDSRQSGHRA